MNSQSQTSQSNDFYLRLSTNSPGHILFLLQACFPTCIKNSLDSFHQMVPDALPPPVFRKLASLNEIIKKKQIEPWKFLRVNRKWRARSIVFTRDRGQECWVPAQGTNSLPQGQRLSRQCSIKPLGKLRGYGGSHPFKQRNTQETEVIKFLFAFNK